MPFAILPAGADRRFGRWSRDAADHLDANYMALCVAPAISPRIFRTGLCLWSRPTVNISICWWWWRRCR